MRDVTKSTEFTNNQNAEKHNSVVAIFLWPLGAKEFGLICHQAL